MWQKNVSFNLIDSLARADMKAISGRAKTYTHTYTKARIHSCSSSSSYSVYITMYQITFSNAVFFQKKIIITSLINPAFRLNVLFRGILFVIVVVILLCSNIVHFIT